MSFRLLGVLLCILTVGVTCERGIIWPFGNNADFISVGGLRDVSDDGAVIVGTVNVPYSSSMKSRMAESSPATTSDEATKWDQNGKATSLGVLSAANPSSRATAVSSDGKVIVGTSFASEGPQAFRWTDSAGMIPLNPLPHDVITTEARDVSADGVFIVGVAEMADLNLGFRWSETTGFDLIDDPSWPRESNGAVGASQDGSVVIGNRGKYGHTRAYRWTATSGASLIDDRTDDSSYTTAIAISDDGTTIVGRQSGDVNGIAFRWTAATGIEDLGPMPGEYESSVATSISADGKVILGTLRTEPEVVDYYVWDAAHGMRLVKDLLTGWERFEFDFFTNYQWIKLASDGRTLIGVRVIHDIQVERWITRLPDSVFTGD